MKTFRNEVKDAEIYSELLAHIERTIEGTLEDAKNSEEMARTEDLEKPDNYFLERAAEHRAKAEAWERLLKKLAK